MNFDTEQALNALNDYLLKMSNKTALIVVDVQNDFAHPEGNLYIPDGEKVIPIINEISKMFKTIVYTQDWHPANTPHFEKDGGVWPVHCVKHTWGAELHSDLKTIYPSYIIHKGVNGEDGYSAFSLKDLKSGEKYQTELEKILKENNINQVVIVGLALDVCVKETAFDAKRLNFDTYIIKKATRAVNLQPKDDEKAIDEMKKENIKVID